MSGIEVTVNGEEQTLAKFWHEEMFTWVVWDAISSIPFILAAALNLVFPSP